jgi:hypothetical protein
VTASSREKYFLNTSAVDALGIAHINLHGVYSRSAMLGVAGAPAQIWEKGTAFPGYHLHLMNMPADVRPPFLPRRLARVGALPSDLAPPAPFA